MNTGAWLTKAAVWLALLAYAIGAGMMLRAQGRARWLVHARRMWTAGCVFFLAHVVFAFGFYHGWSHDVAYRQTARQTAEMTGFRWGGGLFLNYLFALAWLGDVLWWWLAPGSFARRARWLTRIWHGFFFFMVLNGAIVFGSGPVRWFGAAICSILGVLWWRSRATARMANIAAHTPMQ